MSGDFTIGDLADLVPPDERGLQPPRFDDSWVMGDAAFDPTSAPNVHTARNLGNLSQDPYPPAWPAPQPPASPEPWTANEAAADAVRRPYRNTAPVGSSNLQPIAESLAPHSPLEWGLAAAFPGEGLVGRAVSALPRAVRMGAVAAGFGLSSDDAEGAPLRKLMQATSALDLSKPNPLLYHRIGVNKLSRPLEDIPFEATGEPPRTAQVPFASLEGKVVTPLSGDPSISGTTIHSIDGVPLATPFDTWGGHGYIRRFSGYANDAGQATAIANRTKALQEFYGTDVVGAYTKMGPQSVNFSHQTWGPMARMLPNSPITDQGYKDLNEAVRNQVAATQRTETMIKNKEFWPAPPDLRATDLEQQLFGYPDKPRKALIEAIERSGVSGAPDLVAIRRAITDPELLYQPTNSAGLTMTKLTGEIAPGRGPHPDFPRHLIGEGHFGLGMQLPQEVIYPDIVKRFDAQQPPDRWLRKMYMPPTGVPHGQLVTPQLVEDVSRYMEDVGQMGETAALDKYIHERFGWGRF